MEKVILTKKQAEAIERIKRDQIKRFEEVKQFKSDFIISNWEAPLFELDSKDLQDALYVGYEVEPEFKVGDWVVSPSGRTKKIEEIKSKEVTPKNIYTSFGTYYPENLRHATPSEIAEEKEQRTEEKLKKLLSELTQEEIKHLRNKLAWEYESSGRIADLAGDEDE